MKNLTFFNYSVCAYRIYLIGLMFGLLMMAQVACAQPNVVVVANTLDRVQTLDQFALQRIYKMRQKVWQNGESIQVFVLPNDYPLHQTFVQQHLGLSVNQLNRAWSRLVFSGRGVMPTRVFDETQMLQKLQQTPGAIGYVSKEVAQQLSASSLKVIAR